jgi:nitrate/nitrite transporter NarK
VAAVDWYPIGHTALALGVTLGFGRLGSFAADMSPTWAAPVYAGGWRPPLLLAAVIALSSLILAMAYQWVDARRRPAASRAHEPSHPFSLRDVRAFDARFWYLLGLCVLWYATILAFRSTFSIKYFQEAHGLPLAEAGAINSYVFLAALFTTPFFGWVCDRTGRHAGMLALGAALLPVSLAIMLGSSRLGIATVLIGVSYSLVPAALWPLASRLVAPRLLGTAIGLMTAFQNAGIAGANLAAGGLNDAFGASAAHPAGYSPMMWLFIGCGVVGTILAVILWAQSSRAAPVRPQPPSPAFR